MPTSKDLDIAKQKSVFANIQQPTKETSIIKVEDSLSVKTDSKTDSLKRFHVILGSFKDSSNSGKMVELLSKNGYKPILIKLKSGYTLVSAASFNDQREADKEMLKILDTDYAPEDVWVYDTIQKLHNK